MEIIERELKNSKMKQILSNIINWLVIFICIFVMSSCSNNDEKVERTSMTGFSIDIPAKWCLDTNESNAIDSYVGKIILNTRDTLYFEYGKGIYNIVDPVKAIVPVSQKHYWDSVGMGGDVIISNNPALDATLNIYSNEYYLKDTIDNIEVNWVFPKKFRTGKTGAYFFNGKNKNNMSIYSSNIEGDDIDLFVKMVKSVRFNKE